jgi:NTP pyrophosphatase (non-canonical NTP hydrolase)
MNITVEEYQNYLADKYKHWGTTEGLFIKLIEEIGELAEVINTRNGSKAVEGDESFEYELADVLHYLLAIASINGISLNDIILEKDKLAAIKYNHDVNLEQFILSTRSVK